MHYDVDDKSQGRVAAHLKWGEIFNSDFIKNLLVRSSSVSERILKIGEHFAKLRAKV